MTKKKMQLLTCVNEDLGIVGKPQLYDNVNDAQKGMNEDIADTDEMLRMEGMEPILEEGTPTVMRYGDGYCYAWEITEVEIEI